MRIQRLEEEKVQLQRALEGAGVDAIARKKVAADEGRKGKEALSEIRERMRAEGQTLREIQDSVMKTAASLGVMGDEAMELDN